MIPISVRMTAGLLLGGMLLGAAPEPDGVYYLEAEQYVETAGGSVSRLAQGEANFADEAMSGGEYIRQDPASISIYHIPAGSVPPGTYYLAERGFTVYAHPRGQTFEVGRGLLSAENNFPIFVGYTFNEHNTEVAYEWKWVFEQATGATHAKLEVPENTDLSLKVTQVTTSSSFPDVFALIKQDDALPVNDIPADGRFSPQIDQLEP